MRFRFSAPLTANPRMENLFERTFFVRIAKYYRSKCFSIQVPVVRKDSSAKFVTDLLFHFRKIHQQMRCLIGIKKLRRRKKLTQTVAKSAFTCGDSAGDPDRRHDSGTLDVEQLGEKLSRATAG